MDGLQDLIQDFSDLPTSVLWKSNGFPYETSKRFIGAVGDKRDLLPSLTYSCQNFRHGDFERLDLMGSGTLTTLKLDL